MKKSKTVLTEGQKNFIEVYRKHAGNIDKVCKELGITSRSVERYLSEDKVKEQLNKSIEIARKKITDSLPFLVDKAINMINSEKTSEKVKAQLINSLMDKGGLITPKNPTVSININTEISDRARQLLASSLPTLTDGNPVIMRLSDNSQEIT